jgi:hypothetical protein
MVKRVGALMWVVLCCTSVLCAAPPKPARIYVFTAPPAPDGYAAPDLKDRQDSVRDLESRVPSRWIELASQENANVWLEVLRRKDHVGLTVRLTVPGTDHAAEWTEDARKWGQMADQISGRVNKWVKANLRLLSR